MIRSWLLIALLALAPAAARACNPATGDFAGTVRIFQGTIGAYPVRVGLQFDRGGAVGGRYGYANSAGTIALDGKLAGTALRLTEHGGPGGAVAGRFAGTMRKIQGDCGFIGDWTAARGGKTLPVRLAPADASFRKLPYYTSAKALGIERAAVALRAAILAGRRAQVARAIRYPVFVTLRGRRTRIASAAALRANYDAIFTPIFVARIRDAIPHMMFLRDQGTMLGNGELWFDDSGQAIAINN